MSDNNLKIDELEWVRIFDPVHIPAHLIEQVRDKEWTVEKFYQYQKMINLQREANIISVNPLNLLFVLVDKRKIVHGFMWAVVDALSNCLVINTFSIDKDYWGKGNAVKLLEEKTKEIAKGAKLKKIYWITNFPKHSERYGFKRSRSVLMEYEMEEENGKNIYGVGRKASGTGEPDEPRSAELLEQHSEGTRASGSGELPRAS